MLIYLVHAINMRVLIFKSNKLIYITFVPDQDHMKN